MDLIPVHLTGPETLGEEPVALGFLNSHLLMIIVFVTAYVRGVVYALVVSICLIQSLHFFFCGRAWP